MARCRAIQVSRGATEDLIKLSPEGIIVYAARVSNPNNRDTVGQSDDRLLRYCIRNEHWSIFETVSWTVEIETSRAIAQQLIRHRSFTFQEFSQRYAEATDFVVYSPRRQDPVNRQNSVDDLAPEVIEWFEQAQRDLFKNAHDVYQQALGKGIAKECARFVLPLSTKTTLFMTGNVRSWIHYIKLRTGNGTQLEHAEIAHDIKSLFVAQFPVIARAVDF